MQDDLERWRSLWQHDARSTDDLVAAVRAELRRQRLILASEWAVCIVATALGVTLLVAADPTRRAAGACVVAFAVGGAAVAQWARAALVKRLAQAVPPAGGPATGDAAIVARLVAAGWVMIGLASVFVCAILALSVRNAGGANVQPQTLAFAFGAAAFLAGASLWQWRFARRRAKLQRLLESQRESDAPPSA